MAYSFFGIQVAIKNFHRDPLRAKLHSLIAEDVARQTVNDKRRFWKRFTALVNEAMPFFEYGEWDLVRGGAAEAEFQSWTTELEGGTASEPEELGEAADEVNRLSASRTFVLVTMVFLVDRGSNADVTLGERCDLPERDWFTRQTFAHLIATIPLLNPANLQADAVYIMPGNDQDGVSEDDLRGPGYEYLKPLT